MQKEYRYAITSAVGNYIGDWNDVVSDFSLSEEVNSAGSQLKVILARPADDFNERGDVDFNLDVKVYCYDSDNPNGTLVFNGFIADYSPIYGDSEHVEVIVLGYGFELDNYIIKLAETTDQSQATGAGTQNLNYDRPIAQSFVPTTTPLTGVDVKVQTTVPCNITLLVCPTSSSGDYPDINNPVGSLSKAITATAMTVTRFSFTSGLALIIGNKYWVVLQGDTTTQDVTLTVNPNTDDRSIISTDSTYANARAGTGSDVHVLNPPSTSNTIGQYFNGASSYSIYETLLKYDTSTIPDDATLLSAALKIARTSAAPATGFTVEAWLRSSSSPVVAADFVAGASISALTRLATLASSSMTLNTLVAMTNDNLLANISKNGTTNVLLASDKQKSNTAPTGNDTLEIGRAGTAYNTTLAVTYNAAYVNAQISTSNPYANGNLVTYSGGVWTAVSGSDLYFITYSNTGLTTVPYSSTDPGAMLRDLLDKLAAAGGHLTYDTSTVELTGTTVSYTFKTNTYLEGLKKALELAPQDWYFYIDQATNKVHFHAKATTAAHTFTLGKNISDLKIEKRTEGIVNYILFTGGDIGGGINLYKEYSDANSIAAYGRRLLRYSDNRVTASGTANTISNTILGNRKAPELRTTVRVLDNAIDSTKGYDIESIKLGSMVGFGGFAGSSTSLWDVADWDVDYFDFNIAELGSLLLQVVRADRTDNAVTLALSTIPLDVNKRIEDINRNIEALQTANNPTVPT